MAFELLATANGGSAETTFANIPQDGESLALFINSRRSLGNDSASISFNGTRSGSLTRVTNDDGSMGAIRFVTSTAQFKTNRSDTSADFYSTAVLYIKNYATSGQKVLIGQNGVVDTSVASTPSNLNSIALGFADEASSDPINSLTLNTFFTSDTTLSLYRISNS